MAIQPFSRLTAISASLPEENINTDVISPAPAANPLQSMKELSIGDRMKPENLALSAFAARRWNADGSARPEFVLNQPPHDRAQILVTDANFGCGSSRESAVWGLMAIGIRCVIAPSFGDIFYNNCFKNGLLAIRLQPKEIEPLRAVAESDNPELTIDLQAQQIITPTGHTQAFHIDAYKRHCLLNGLDEIGATLEKLPQIERIEADYFKRRPWLARSRQQ
jgi:3-isopropylmalate/(R)-2-methylmalate dehydratase small subunit